MPAPMVQPRADGDIQVRFHGAVSEEVQQSLLLRLIHPALGEERQELRIPRAMYRALVLLVEQIFFMRPPPDTGASCVKAGATHI